MNGNSTNITEAKLAALREVLPEAFAEGELDWEKLRVLLTRDGEFNDERYHLNWAGKTDAYRALQAPTSNTLAPMRDASVGFDDAQHVFIEGENLAVLKALQKAYFGTVKMIYIDPPYNTGNDFIYSDRFAMSKKDYQKRVGDLDAAGNLTRENSFRKNSRDNGHYHSNWLSMMYPRLFLARNLLREDGVIFVSIDDNEAHNLRLVMNEIFGEENFVACIVRRRRQSQANLSVDISVIHEYLLVYRKSSDFNFNRLQNAVDESNYQNPDNDSRGPYVTMPCTNRGGASYAIKTPTGKTYTDEWRFKESTFNKLLSDNRIVFPKGGDGKPRYKMFLSDRKAAGALPNSWWGDVAFNQEATAELQKIFSANLFSNPKPMKLIRTVTTLSTNEDSIILDFFAGSCTTAHAVLDLNFEDGGKRKFICVQMPEKCDEKSDARKAGYATIADIGRERIRRVIAAGKLDAGMKAFKLRESNFKQWRGDVKDADELAAQMEMHTDPLVAGAAAEDVLYELLLKSGVQLTAPLQRHDGWWLADDGEAKIAVALTRIDAATVAAMLEAKPTKVIALDRLFQGDDQLKTNTALQMRDAEVEFEAV